MKGDSIIYQKISSYNLAVEYVKYVMIPHAFRNFQFVSYCNTSFMVNVCYFMCMI